MCPKLILCEINLTFLSKIHQPSLALNIMYAAFSSGPSSVYRGAGVVANSDLLSFVSHNDTRALLWSLFKPLHEVTTSQSILLTGLDWIYIGFEDGSFLGYSPNSQRGHPGALHFSNDRNSTWCGYDGNSTNPTTGKNTGPATVCLSFDPTIRPVSLIPMICDYFVFL